MPNETPDAQLTANVGTVLPTNAPGLLQILPLGLSLSTFFALTFSICVLFDLIFPDMAMNPVWSPLLPGFTWLSPSSFALGFVESVAYGWYIALVFAPLYNIFVVGTTLKQRRSMG